jgi:hypothetical protein
MPNKEKLVLEDLFNQPAETIHEALGNDPEQWKLKAESLCQAASLLYQSIGEPPQDPKDPKLILEWFNLHDIGRMLRGMALECLLKAIWLAHGELLVKDGGFVGIPKTKSHDLYAMYLASFSRRKPKLSKQEVELLARLSFAITSARYPISKSPKGDYPSAPKARHKMYWNKCEHNLDTKLFETLWEKLEVALYEKT